MSEHTREPWRYHDEFILAGGTGRDGMTIAMNPGAFHFETDPVAEANARRIVACVNFCKRMKTEHMENYVREGFVFDPDNWEPK